VDNVRDLGYIRCPDAAVDIAARTMLMPLPAELSGMAPD
jgi:hypothetical protein